MGIKKIVEKNKEFNEWKQNLENEIKTKHQEIIEFNKSQLLLDDYKDLSYEDAKEVFEVVKFNLDYNTQRKDTVETLNNIKEETFKILKVAHYYPVINELNYLTDEKKNEVDKLLYMVRVGNYIHTSSQVWYRLRLTQEISEKLLNDLFEKGVLEKGYQLLCSNCGDYIKILSEETYLNQKKMFEIFDKQRENKATDDEIEWCENLMENGGRVWEISCMDCEDEYQEIEKFEQLESRAKVIYKVKAQPDLTYARK